MIKGLLPVLVVVAVNVTGSWRTIVVTFEDILTVGVIFPSPVITIIDLLAMVPHVLVPTILYTPGVFTVIVKPVSPTMFTWSFCHW